MIRRPHLRDAVEMGGREYHVVAEAVRPVRGLWLGREGGAVVCQPFVALSDWTFKWDAEAQRWEGE